MHGAARALADAARAPCAGGTALSAPRAHRARARVTRVVRTRAGGTRCAMMRARGDDDRARARAVDDGARAATRGTRFDGGATRDARRRGVVTRAGGGAVAPMETFKKFSEVFANLFPIWTILAAVVGVTKPATFAFMTNNAYTACLALLMFSMGITLTLDDFKRVFLKPRVIGLGFFACYVLMPALAFVIGNALGLSGPLLAGLILVGSINGGQASNLCAYIARGDVALSVLMTTATTVGCIFMTPLICKLALGAVVDVDAMGMAISTIQVVLVPVVLGLTLNKYVPKFCRSVEPFSPVVGVTATIILVGGAVANCAAGILGAGMTLQIAAFMLHLIGGVAGYWIMRAFKYGETTCRTVAIETAMKSSAFGFLLASLHFPEYLVRVPSAVSVVWMAVLGSTMAVVWRFIPVPDEN
jgi:BASS family bile acid:Na+ symporter